MVLTPEVEPLIGELYRLHSNAGGDGMTPDITLLVPFVPAPPSKPFVELVGALSREFPDYPPYEGIHDEVVPHATVAEGDDQALFDRIIAELESQLPVWCRAEAAAIVERGTDRRWRSRVGLPLGG